MKRVGIIGTGYIARGVADHLASAPDFELTRVLSRRNPATVDGFGAATVTNSVDELIDQADIVVECCGDAVWATDALIPVADAKLPIVTMDSEFQLSVGSWFVDRTYITEADGDQPGSFARLHQELLAYGFEPMAYVNIKGFLNHNPSPEEMKYWAGKQGLSVEQTTAFTDGTKMQIEQAFVANGLDADIAQTGLVGGEVDSLLDSGYLAERAEELGHPIADYVLSKGAPAGVYALFRSPELLKRASYAPFAKNQTTDGKSFMLLRPYHLIHAEVLRTLRDVVQGAAPLLQNGRNPRISVAAIAKRHLPLGQRIDRALGGFEFRGEAVRFAEHPQHVPICLMKDAVLKRPVDPGQMLSWEDIDIAESRALQIHRELHSGNGVKGLS